MGRRRTRTTLQNRQQVHTSSIHSKIQLHNTIVTCGHNNITLRKETPNQNENTQSRRTNSSMIHLLQRIQALNRDVRFPEPNIRRLEGAVATFWAEVRCSFWRLACVSGAGGSNTPS